MVVSSVDGVKLVEEQLIVTVNVLSDLTLVEVIAPITFNEYIYPTSNVSVE